LNDRPHTSAGAPLTSGRPFRPAGGFLRHLFGRHGWSTWLVLACGTALVATAWHAMRAQALKNAEDIFETRARAVIEAIEGRMRDHAQILLGGVGLFEASDQVDRLEWRAYIRRLELAQNYPGIQGVGYSKIIPPADLPAHLAAVRAEGFPDYTIRPPGARELYSSIVYLEPFAGRNLAAFGYDMFSEPTRRKAMQHAAETGKPTISGKVTLVQETHGPQQAGFLMYVPVYRRGSPTDTARERREALEGFVYSPYRMNNLMDGVLGGRNLDIGFVILDGTPGSDEERRLYASDAPANFRPDFRATRIMNFYGHSWTIELHALPGFLEQITRSRWDGAPLAGELLVLLLAGLTFSVTAGRVRAQNLAEEMSWRTRMVLETVVDGIITIDARGIVETFNPAAAKIFGYDAPEVVGRNVRMLMPPPYRDEHDGYITNYLRTGDAKIIGRLREVAGRRKDGSTFPMELAVSEATAGGKRIFTGIVRDITERKRIERDLQTAKTDAEQANRAKSEFLSRMSHELRTPLNAVLGFAQLLQYNPKEPLTKAQSESVRLILSGGKYLLNLINDILDIAKIETGKLSVSIEDVNPAQVIGECLPLIESMAEKRNITVVRDFAEVGNVRADYTRLRQCVLNLLSNAVKYNRDGGGVAIAVTAASDRSIRIAVSDTGVGIPRERQKELFRPFSRLGAEARQIEGSGIGLALTHELITLMNGQIGCESEPDVGTVFWIELPGAEPGTAAARAAEAAPAARPEASATRILYIEDNPINLELVRAIVRQVPNFELTSAHTGELGIESARLSLPDVILLDINLPGMNGYDVLRHLQATRETARIPVIALTAAATRADIERGTKAGFFRYLTKPLNVAELLESIAVAADRKI
jgi:PAS domain S-box-containing protein